MFPAPSRRKAKQWTPPEPKLLKQPRPVTVQDHARWRDQDLRFAENVRWWCAERGMDPVSTEWFVACEMSFRPDRPPVT